MRISPATALLHEIVHVFNAWLNGTAFVKRMHSDNYHWSNDEEFINITNTEWKIAEDLGEDKRKQYLPAGSVVYQTVSPISTNDYLTCGTWLEAPEVKFE